MPAQPFASGGGAGESAEKASQLPGSAERRPTFGDQALDGCGLLGGDRRHVRGRDFPGDAAARFRGRRLSVITARAAATPHIRRVAGLRAGIFTKILQEPAGEAAAIPGEVEHSLQPLEIAGFADGKQFLHRPGELVEIMPF